MYALEGNASELVFSSDTSSRIDSQLSATRRAVTRSPCADRVVISLNVMCTQMQYTIGTEKAAQIAEIRQLPTNDYPEVWTWR
jgi:hypothetical protein